ncbi:hypothetical protein C4D60_Mb03t11200 [Musa balbisiana]|uniref:Uncharacterized protein n=1 Tax=Musa balbisiana TaxID=52838 RepID=A0A4V4H614_MUSBA|nr:hypothetical protein C4D60_Mb03t11200 [Musa balbisiana]
MAEDPYTSCFKGYFDRCTFPSTFPSSLPATTHSFYANFTNYATPHFQPSPPSPPLREALPLLSLSPTRHHRQQQRQEEGEDSSCSAFEEAEGDATVGYEKNNMEEETVSVALHIGLPSPSEADLISRISSTSVDDDKEIEEDGGGGGGGSDAIPLGHPTVGKLTRDAYVGPWVAVQEGTGIAEGDAADGDAAASVLLLRARVQEQHRPPEVEAAQGLPDPANSLQAEARDQAVHVPEMRQGFRGARRLAHPREELRQAVVLHLRLRLQAQAIAQGPYQGVAFGSGHAAYGIDCFDEDDEPSSEIEQDCDHHQQQVQVQGSSIPSRGTWARQEDVPSPFS